MCCWLEYKSSTGAWCVACKLAAFALGRTLNLPAGASSAKREAGKTIHRGWLSQEKKHIVWMNAAKGHSHEASAPLQHNPSFTGQKRSSIYRDERLPEAEINFSLYMLHDTLLRSMKPEGTAGAGVFTLRLRAAGHVVSEFMERFVELRSPFWGCPLSSVHVVHLTLGNMRMIHQ